MTEAASQTGEAISFGHFTLVPSERHLTKDGTTVHLSARALDILIALMSSPNRAVSKRELIAQVWPDVTVGEGSLRFHIAGLRKALGDGVDGARYITTLAGRGYCFVAPISRSSIRGENHASVVVSFPRANMPSRLMRMVGRADGIRMLSTQLTAVRFVTIVGAGGVGKTTVAVAVAHHLIDAFAGVVLFVDLGTLNDPKLAAASLASMLGLSISSDDPASSLVAYLRDKRILLILDNCEHIIEAAAPLAARIYVDAPQVHILATSREALRVEGEHVHRLAPLAYPPDDSELTVDTALTFPAVQLFVERATASGTRLDLTDSDVVIVAGICRKLDGVALAIELVAARVEAFGLQQIAALLDERLSLLWQGQRTAPPRQQTLKAMLDWSYGLLTGLERKVLQQLAVFVGDFTLSAALAVLPSATLDQIHVLGALENLVAKSMVATSRDGSTVRYRLLDTTRAYVLEFSDADAYFGDLSARHAKYCCHWLQRTAEERLALPNTAVRPLQLADLGNLRAALEWCFGPKGNIEIGIELASAAAPAFLTMSLLTECHSWSEQALRALDPASRAGPAEMHLQAAVGMSLMFAHGESEAARTALNRSLMIAEQSNDAINQLRLLGTLHMFHGRIADFNAALHYAKRGSVVSRMIGDPAALAFGHRLLGVALHHAGDLSGARAELEAALLHNTGSGSANTPYLGFDDRILVNTGLARNLWLQGQPNSAVELARQTVKDAADAAHPITLCMASVWMIVVLLWTGALEAADEYADQLVSNAESYSLGPYRVLGRGIKGHLAICSGNAEQGVASLQACLDELHAARYELLTTLLNIALTGGLTAIGRSTDAIALIEETISSVETNGDLCYLPELLRVKGNLLLSMPQPDHDKAERYFRDSLRLSQHQGARAWELRTAIDLATLLVTQRRSVEAEACLRPVFEQFVEGLDTADPKAAASLLAVLG